LIDSLIQQANKANNSSTLGGLASVLNQGMAGYHMGQDKRQRGAVNQAVAEEMQKKFSPKVKGRAAELMGTVDDISLAADPGEYSEELIDKLPSAPGTGSPGTMEEMDAADILKREMNVADPFLNLSETQIDPDNLGGRTDLPANQVFATRDGVKAQAGHDPYQSLTERLVAMGGDNPYASRMAANMGMQQASADRDARIKVSLDAKNRQAAREDYLFQQQNKAFPPSKPSTKYSQYVSELQAGNTDLSFSNWSAQFDMAKGGMKPNFFSSSQSSSQPSPQQQNQTAPQLQPQPTQSPGEFKEPQDPGPFVLPNDIIPNSRAAIAAEQAHDRKVSAYDRKLRALKPEPLQYKKYHESVDMVDASDESIASIDYAMGLSPQSFDGMAAEERAYIVKNFMPKGLAPQTYSKAINTGLMSKAITEKALGSLKATFGGMPTEGERKILLDIQGSAELPQEERDNLWKRAKELVLLSRKREMRKINIFEQNHPKRYSAGYSGKKAYGSGKPPVPSADSGAAPSAVLKFDANGNPIK
jgi:hypothetical protein